MANAIAIVERPQSGPDAKAIESVLIQGDLSKLTPEQSVSYYNSVCQSLGLNPLTKPFAYLTLSGKKVLYALKDATEQLRKLHGVSITELTSQRIDDVFVVTAKAQDASGRTDGATGAVAIANLKGEALANALMKAETKAKRRATLSICGLGMLDETEADEIAQRDPQPVVAPPTARLALAAGTVQILKVEPKTARGVSWCEVTYITADGEEKTLPTKADHKEAAVAHLEALLQDGEPVVIETAVGPRNGKTVIVKATKKSVLDAAALDAEVVEADVQAGAF